MKIKTKLKRYLTTLKKELNDLVSQSAFKEIEQAIENLKEEEKDPLDTSTFETPKQILGKDKAIAIFSDGACRGNPGPGAWACVAQDYSGHILFELSEVDKHTTNNRMELLGAYEGMMFLKNYLLKQSQSANQIELHVFTDSQYLVNGMNSWVLGWKNRGWKKADNKVPENVEIWQNLDNIKTEFKSVMFHWVKGHAGHPQNEFCDKLANLALDNEGH